MNYYHQSKRRHFEMLDNTTVRRKIKVLNKVNTILLLLLNYLFLWWDKPLPETPRAKQIWMEQCKTWGKLGSHFRDKTIYPAAYKKAIFNLDSTHKLHFTLIWSKKFPLQNQVLYIIKYVFTDIYAFEMFLLQTILVLASQSQWFYTNKHNF